MILDGDNSILESTNAELYRPKRKPVLDYDAYIYYLPNMTFRDWIDGVPYCVFEEFVLRDVELIKEKKGRFGEYLPAIKFSDHILNFTISGSDPWPYGSNPEISIDFVLCNRGLRDAVHRKDLIIYQKERFNTYRYNHWSIFLDKHTITRFMYDFMRAVKDNIILQEYSWRF